MADNPKDARQVYTTLVERYQQLKAAAAAPGAGPEIRRMLGDLERYLATGQIDENSPIYTVVQTETRGSAYENNPQGLIAAVNPNAQTGQVQTGAGQPSVDPVLNAVNDPRLLPAGSPGGPAGPPSPIGPPRPPALQTARPGGGTLGAGLNVGANAVAGIPPTVGAAGSAAGAAAAAGAAGSAPNAPVVGNTPSVSTQANGAPPPVTGPGANTTQAPAPGAKPSAGGPLKYGQLADNVLADILGAANGENPGSGDPEFLTGAALAALGEDYTGPMGMRGESLEKGIAPFAKNAITFQGLGLGGDPNSTDLQGQFNDIQRRLASYGAAGQNFYGTARQQILDILNGSNDETIDEIGSAGDIFDQIENMQFQATAGSNPMVRRALQNKLARVAREYKNSAYSGAGATVMDWLRESGQLQKLIPGLK